MSFFSQAPAQLARVVASAAFALVLLASCGGGTSQQDPFVAQRLITFGDEYSVLEADGRRWGVNGLDEDDEFDCALQPIWVQSLAAVWGLTFAECNPDDAEPKAFIRAASGARLADLSAQIDAQVAAGGFRARDLATVLVGMHDIFDLYQQYPDVSADTLVAQARARGGQLAALVNRMVSLGTVVVVSNLPDLSLTPYARGENETHDDPGRTELIWRMTAAFNEELGVRVLLDGRYVGLVQLDLISQAIGRYPGGYGFTNISDPVCAVALPDCTTDTLVEEGNASLYLWAGDRQFTSAGHFHLASQAVTIAQRNPF